MKTISVKKRVYLFINSYDYLYCNRKPRLDMRYNASREFLRLFYKLTKDFDKEGMKKKLIERRLLRNSQSFSNILNNKLYIDFKKNRGDVKCVHDSYIEFHGRNHYAKNEEDFKVLSILKRYFKR